MNDLKPLVALTALLLSLASSPAIQIAPTEAIAPEEQQTKFKLPEGFEIQLVVSEPDIGQPMNLNFDARGRLWISHSVEYPFPAEAEGVEKNRGRFAGKGREMPHDRLTQVEIGANGKAENLTHFVDGLNIPIGQTPLEDGSTALVYGIPSIFKCSDENGDGVADTKETLFTGFGNRDTHGMANSFTRWIDGWIYGCHGFSNKSTIKDGSGHVTSMSSGNTYRFKEDGSRFEPFTYGQVNPFGMTFDPLGNLYDADCHSKPVYLLLRGAQYPQFGNKPGTLGFGPTMIDHNHGSTGVCGPAYYAATRFPEEYHDNLFICNPVSEKIHRDKLKRFGSTLLADTQPDFVTCDDPWFRPVDAIVGPDGALYIADFYNAIIGHYEQPLTHPKRDRTHGRVWRVVFGETKPPEDLTLLSKEELLKRLGHPNLAVRVFATNLLVERGIQPDITSGSSFMKAHGMWVLERLGTLPDHQVLALAEDPDPLVRVHLARVLAEREEIDGRIPIRLLNDSDAFVRRAAADAMMRHVKGDNAKPLAQAWLEADPKDTHLIHTVRLALRELFRNEEAVKQITDDSFALGEKEKLLAIAMLVRNDASKRFLARHAEFVLMDFEALKNAGPLISTESELKKFIDVVTHRYPNDLVRQFQLLGDLKGVEPWFKAAAPELLAVLENSQPLWVNHPLSSNSKAPWGLAERTSADGKKTVVIDSIVHGEQRTGLYRSRTFTIPETLSFWMCGHNGLPNTNPEPVNHIRLVLAESGQEIAREIPPRHDTARKFTWNLKEHAGKQGRIEIVDADSGKSYAWIGVGRFDPPVVRVPDQLSAEIPVSFVTRIAEFELKELYPRVIALISDKKQTLEVRTAAANAFLGLEEKSEILPILGRILNDASEPVSVRKMAGDWLGRAGAWDILASALSNVPAAVEREIAMAFSSTKEGVGVMIQAVEEGNMSARVLQDKQVESRLKPLASAEHRKRIEALVKGTPDYEEGIERLIADRRRRFNLESASFESGRPVFMKNCALCHRIGNEGGLIGPQLDGIGQRGIDRLLEDVIDPNRNVDEAFQMSVVVTKSDAVFTGLQRREEGDYLILADIQGKEIRVLKKDIMEKKVTRISTMPPGFGAGLSEQEMHDLMAFLLKK